MKLAYLITLGAALCLSGTMHAQRSCGAVSDEAHVLNGSLNANALIDRGADVHVVTVQAISKYGHRLLDVERAYEKDCPNWVGPDGKRKSNLLVIMVAPNDKIKNIFLGSTYDGLFSGEDAVNQMYAKAANEKFRSKNWTGGINATVLALNQKIEEQKNPPASAGTKMGFFIVMFILVMVGGFIALFAWILPSRRAKKAEKRRTEAMQQKAILARNDATDAFTSMPKDNPSYSSFAVKYTNLSNSIAMDPTTDGLTADGYETIWASWDSFRTGVERAVRPASSSTPSAVPPPRPSPTKPQESNRSKKSKEWHNRNQYRPTPIDRSTTTIINNSSGSGDLVNGMILGEMLSENHHHDRDDYDRSSSRDKGSSGSDSSFGWGSSSSSDSGSSGNDSGWGSSDSGSSFDSGSSSFDSGSSDSGSSGSDSSW